MFISLTASGVQAARLDIFSESPIPLIGHVLIKPFRECHQLRLRKAGDGFFEFLNAHDFISFSFQQPSHNLAIRLNGATLGTMKRLGQCLREFGRTVSRNLTFSRLPRRWRGIRRSFNLLRSSHDRNSLLVWSSGEVGSYQPDPLASQSNSAYSVKACNGEHGRLLDSTRDMIFSGNLRHSELATSISSRDSRNDSQGMTLLLDEPFTQAQEFRGHAINRIPPRHSPCCFTQDSMSVQII